MIPIQWTQNEASISKEAIQDQMTKIFKDPVFVESAILKRFLVFIVNETLDGRANCLKEYTIAVGVLGKPANFKPSENGIVRIHAGRLRRALEDYYHHTSTSDTVYISIPKGKYVPEFSNASKSDNTSVVSPIAGFSRNNGTSFIGHAGMVIAVLPFTYQKSNDLLESFTSGLTMQLSSALMHFENLCVIAPQAITSLLSRTSDIRELATNSGADIVITGHLQYSGDRIRVNLQMIRTSNYQQVWSELHETNLTKSSIFKVQDEIVGATVSKFENSGVHSWMRQSQGMVMAAV
jgi:TolB-like protein